MQVKMSFKKESCYTVFVSTYTNNNTTSSFYSFTASFSSYILPTYSYSAMKHPRDATGFLENFCLNVIRHSTKKKQSITIILDTALSWHTHC